MARRGTVTFIVERPLTVSARDEHEMLVRLKLAHQLSNACLGEALRRLDLMRESLDYARARAMPKTAGKKPSKERAAAFAALRHRYGFTSDSISAFGTQCKNEGKRNEGHTRIDPRVGAHECQRIAERAFSAAEMYAFGVRGRTRFKGKGRPLHSLEGKSAGSSICWNAGTGCLEWGGLRLAAMFAPDGRDPWLGRGSTRPVLRVLGCLCHDIGRQERHPLEPGACRLAGCAIAARPCGVDAPERASTCERGEHVCRRAGGFRPAEAGTGRTAKGLSHRRCFGWCSRKTRADGHGPGTPWL